MCCKIVSYYSRKETASNQNVAKPWFNFRCGNASLFPWNNLEPSNLLTKDMQCKQNHSVLEWYVRQTQRVLLHKLERGEISFFTHLCTVRKIVKYLWVKLSTVKPLKGGGILTYWFAQGHNKSTFWSDIHTVSSKAAHQAEMLLCECYIKGVRSRKWY